MSQCTCTKDAQMTCIVHPTEQALKARIAELESLVASFNFVDAARREENGQLKAENQRLRDIAQKQRSILNRYDLAPDIHQLLRTLHMEILGGGE